MRYVTRLLCFLLVVSAAGSLRAEEEVAEYRGATVSKIGEKLVVTFDVGGKKVNATIFPLMEGFDKDGKELDFGHGLRILKEGNVVDFKTESMALTGKPETYIIHARLIKGELMPLAAMRDLAPKTRKPREEAILYTVTKSEGRGPVTLRGPDGKQISVRVSLDKAVDASGKELSKEQLAGVLKEGNVIEAELKPSSNGGILLLKEARLVSGELADARTKPAAPDSDNELLTEYRGAVLKRFGISKSVIEVNGKDIALGGWTDITVFLDAKGERISSGPAILKAIKPGSVVDVTLAPPPKRGDGKPLIREMKLVRPAE